MKKFIAAALSLMLLITAYAVSEGNNRGLACGDYQYTLLADQTAEIVAYSGLEENLIIPDQLNGHRVVSIGSDAFYECTSLKSVVLPEGLLSIKRSAFDGCSELSSILIPDSVTFIGNYAFFCCTGLTTITLPAGIQTIEGNPFDTCLWLSEIIIKEDHPRYSIIDNVLIDKQEKRLICYPAGLENEEYTIPQGILSIGDYAFTGNDMLTKITVPQGVTSIGNGAFMLCDELTSVVLPDGLTSIGRSAFDSCRSLETLAIPGSVTMIGEETFYDCEALTLNVGSNAYAKKYAEENGIKAIAGTAEEDSQSDDYEYVPLTDNTAMIVRYVGKNKELTIPESINGYKIVSIGREAFSFKGLKTVVIPDSVETIEDYAFTMNRDLEEVTLSKNLKTLGEGAFCMTNLQSVTLSDTIETMYGNPFQACSVLSEIVISPDHPRLALIDNALFDKEEKKLICYLIPDPADAYTIPKGTLSIGDYAFRFCENLSEITLPKSIQSIGKYAFNGCKNLKKIAIPKGVKTIEEKTFQGCSSLEEITVPDGVFSIGVHAFSGCKNLTSITIADSVETISNDAFMQSENVTIVASQDSYAAEFAGINGIAYTQPKAMGWLSKLWK